MKARERSNEGRLARFQVSFVESGENTFPETGTDAKASGLSAAETLVAAASAAFETAFSIANQPAFIVQAAADQLEAISTFMQNAIAKFTQPIDNLTYALRNIQNEALVLVRTPSQLAARVQSSMSDLLAELEDLPETAEKILNEFRNIADEFEAITGTSASQTAIRNNQSALLSFTKQSAYGYQAQAALNTTFGNASAALQVRNQVYENLDLESYSVTDDELFQSIKQLQSQLIKALPPVDLADLVSYRVSNPVPAILIAYELYGDLEREQEIIDQNSIAHPGFVPGGTELEVAGV